MVKTYSFHTLDDPADPNTPSFTNLLGINEKGLIAGFYGSGNMGDPNQGFLLTLPGTFTPENFPATSQNPVTGDQVLQTQMTGLNNNGVEVGYFYNTNNGVPVDNQFGFYVKDGVFTEVNNPNTPGLFGNPPTPPAPGKVLIENQLIGVNDHDIAVGFYNDASSLSHGYTYNIKTGMFSANIDDPAASNGGSTVTTAIDNKGEIVGFYTDTGPTAGATTIHGFVDNHGVFTTVNAPVSGATITELLGVNDHGIAVGFYTDASGNNHGIVYNTKAGTFTTLDDPNGSSTTLNGINDKGDIVGFYSDAAGNTHGLLATPHDMVKLVGVMDHHLVGVMDHPA